MGKPKRPLRAGCSGRGWQEATAPYRRACQAANAPCALCGQPIDYSLPHNHKRAFTVDHIHPLWAGNKTPRDPSGWQPAHRTCNASRGATEGNNNRTRRNQRTERTW